MIFKSYRDIWEHKGQTFQASFERLILLSSRHSISSDMLQMKIPNLRLNLLRQRSPTGPDLKAEYCLIEWTRRVVRHFVPQFFGHLLGFSSMYPQHHGASTQIFWRNLELKIAKIPVKYRANSQNAIGFKQFISCNYMKLIHIFEIARKNCKIFRFNDTIFCLNYCNY